MKQIKAGSLFRHFYYLAVVVAEDGEDMWECQVMHSGDTIFLHKHDILDTLL